MDGCKKIGGGEPAATRTLAPSPGQHHHPAENQFNHAGGEKSQAEKQNWFDHRANI